MRNLVNKHIVLFLVLISISWTAFGQKTDWEEEGLQGKVKKYELFSYDFDISDSINHDDFMKRFYLCDFDVERMIRFADSIKTEIDRKGIYVHEYDSLGYLVKILLGSGVEDEIKYQNEYDDQGRLMSRVREIDNEPRNSIFVKYDDLGRITEERYWSHVTGYRTMQWIYDSEGRLLEENRVEDDSVYSYFRKKYDKKGVLRKSERFGFPRNDSKIYCEYDSKGNVVFERTENGSGDIVKAKTKYKYKYDKNDSIVKETCWETRWYKMPKYKDEVWQEIDSTGQLIDYSNYIVEYNEYKTKSKSVRTISRDEKGTPVEEIYEVFDENGLKPRSVLRKKYDELGRVVEKEHIGDSYPGTCKMVWRYYKDTQFNSYYATYWGENFDFGHESLFFFDDQGNCIAHIQWMPETQNSEYYFEVYRYEYYE